MFLKAVRDPDIIPRLCALIATRKRIRAEDVRNLNRYCPRGLRLTLGEAEAVFDVARANFPACVEWSDYFAEAMGFWFVDTYAGDRPPAEAATQLIGWLGGPLALLDPARIKLLMRVLEWLPDCPEDLFAFARGALVRAMGVSIKAMESGAA